jgi:predicted metal-dependent phosphoesterase TrpH
MLADLHAHTWYSDGSLAPEVLLARAAANQLTHLAITDHDTTAALDTISAHWIAPGLTLIPGVEISSLWDRQEIHIVGIGIDRQDTTLQTLLLGQQALRRERAAEMDMRLQKAGITGLQAYLSSLPCTAVGRNHVAQFLIDKGVARSKEHAFKNFLGDRGRYGAAAKWCSIEAAIAAIRAAGGIAILAHPNRYKISNPALRRLVSEFKAAGGQGIEVSYSNLDADRMDHLASLCLSNELWASTGSDFHTPTNHWMDLGKFRYLPARCADRAIWLHPEWPGRGSAMTVPELSDA